MIAEIFWKAMFVSFRRVFDESPSSMATSSEARSEAVCAPEVIRSITVSMQGTLNLSANMTGFD